MSNTISAHKEPLKHCLDKDDFKEALPEIIYSAKPELSEFYNFAWECAYNHIKCCDGVPQSPFMDEAFALDRIWIWDTCFMAFYCKYAPHIFPGIESLDNFYVPMLDGAISPLKIHIPDNPPLFAWAEIENFRVTGNRERLENVFFNKCYPQRMFDLFEKFQSGQCFAYMSSCDPVQWGKTPMGYHWSSGRCGMDNTPRGDFGEEIFDNDAAYKKILFVDALAQQALSAKIIHDVSGEEQYLAKYNELCDLLNKFYWDDSYGIYYDINTIQPHERVKVKTPASFWPMIAGACTQEQAFKMVDNVLDADTFGGQYPFPFVARDSKHFNPCGRYWRGGVWLPTAYMAIKALEKYGFYQIADELSERIVMQQYHTWRDISPHTIWEAYSPSEPCPSSGKFNSDEIVCPDFCGWSALGPICLTIENVLGLKANAESGTINWRLHHDFCHGIRNFRFGDIITDLLYDGDKSIKVKANKSFKLIINDKKYKILAGEINLIHPQINGSEKEKIL